MSKDFIIIKPIEKKYIRLVLNTSTNRPDLFISSIESELISKKIEAGVVLMDLLPCNNFQDRFYSFHFNGKSIELTSLRKVSTLEVHNGILEHNATFYLRHIDDIFTGFLYDSSSRQEIINTLKSFIRH